jgi:hypothetical protein
MMQAPLGSTRLAEVTMLGLKVRRDPKSWEAFEKIWDLAFSLYSASPWNVGDAYLLGERLFGEQIAQVIVANRVKRRRLQAIVRVCRFWHRHESGRKKRNHRREVSFSHHEAVTGLAMDSDQGFAKACALLDKAAADPEISAGDLEAEARKLLGDEDPDASAETDVAFTVGTMTARLERYHRTGDNILKDMPPDYSEERALLVTAIDSVSNCLNSFKNREAGGQPALIEEEA